jgi:hypothetical protein
LKFHSDSDLMIKRIYLSEDSTLTRKKTDKIVGYLNGAGVFVPYKKTISGSQVHIMIVKPEVADEFDKKLKAKLDRKIKEDISLN